MLLISGAEWGNWVVPSVDIKLTLAGFHREVRRGLPLLPANSCTVPVATVLAAAALRALVATVGELIVGGRAAATTQHLCQRE